MSTSQRVQILRLLAVGLLSIVATGCLKSKMSEQNAVRTEGADARYLETVPVQTESGQPGLCLYSAQGSPSAAGSIDPSNTGGAEVISRHALYQGELIQGLETIPGIDAIREAVINDLVTPTAIISSAALAAAGRFSSIGVKSIAAPQNAAAQVKPATPITDPSRLLPSNTIGREVRNLSRVEAGLQGKLAKNLEDTISGLEGAGYKFDTAEARESLNRVRTGQLSQQDWLKGIVNNVSMAGDDTFKTNAFSVINSASATQNRYSAPLDEVRSSLQSLASSSNPTDEAKALAQKVYRAHSPLISSAAADGSSFARELSRGRPQAGTTATKRALMGIRLKVPENFKNLCMNAKGSSWAKAGLCSAGVVAGVFGLGNLAMGFLGGSSADTDSIRSAIAADAASSPDVVIDGNSYAKLIEGLRQFSDRIAADPTIQSMRPTCQ